VDSGAEFMSRVLDAWAQRHDVKLAISRPGTPTDNPFVEAFNGRVRQEGLDQQWFYSLDEARNCFRRMEERLQHDPAPYRAGQPDTGSLRRCLA
jgi:putative transposase